MNQLRTGDIIMFGGTGGSSGCIRFGSLNKRWSHIGVVVRIRMPDGRDVMGLSEAYPTIIGADLTRTGRERFHVGTQTTDLRTRLNTYKGQVAFRRLTYGDGRPVIQQERDAWSRMYPAFLAEAEGEYTMDPIRMLQNMHHHDDDLTGKAYVCTGWAARILQRFGILTRVDIEGQRLEWGNFTLMDFSDLGHLAFTKNAKFEEIFAYDRVHFIVGRAGT